MDPTERDINAGIPAIFSFMMGWTGTLWQRLKVAGDGALQIANANASAVTCGSKATSTSAAQIVAATTTGGFLLSAPQSNTSTIYIGPSAGIIAAIGPGVYPLEPGASVAIQGDLSAWYAIAASGTPAIAWIGQTL